MLRDLVIICRGEVFVLVGKEHDGSCCCVHWFDGNDLVVNDEVFWATKMVPSHITIEIDATAFIVKCRTLI